jgi:hypothetical protein
MRQKPFLRSNLILIGCGPHYQKKYHSVLEQHGAKIALLIDLQSHQDAINLFFHDKSLKPQHTLFLEEHYRNAITLQDIHAFIKKQINISSIDGVIISTDPKARKAYAIWAAKQGLSIFMDKPVSAFSNLAGMDKLLDDYEEIAQAANQRKVDIVVSCERRAHPGYIWTKEYLRKFIDEIKVPITGIDIHFSGGIWRLPYEYAIVENHPFKHGYGIILHSGYHYVDLLATFLSLNHSLFNPHDIKYLLQVMASRPVDQLEALAKHDYLTLSKSEELFHIDFNQWNHLGETDVLVIGQAQKNNAIITNFSLKMFGTSLSLRKTVKSSQYQQLEGRVRQEHVILHLGHLCSLNIISNPLKKLDPTEYPIEDFTITVMNNPLLQGRNPIMILSRKDISQLSSEIPETTSINSYSRKWQLSEFLQGRDGNSSLESHRHTVKLLDMIYSHLKTQLLAQTQYEASILQPV